MTTTALDQGLDLWQNVAETLNEIVRTEGSIQVNNQIIWSNYLNRWENEDWELVLTAIAFLLEQHPEVFKKFQVDAFKETARALVKYQNSTDRVLDKKLFKKSAWKMLMSMREIWNKASDLNTPIKTRRLDEFSNLFEG